MTENEIARIAVNAAFKIHSRFGPGLLGIRVQKILGYELRKHGLFVRHQLPLPVVWEEVRMKIGLRPDLVINDKVIIEVKSLEKTAPIHKKVLLTYLRVADMRLGLLLNFGQELMKDGIFRVVNGLVD